jgi:uncharacterized membrane protein
MVTFTAGGVTDWLWVLPLTVCALLLHRGNYAWCGFWLGLACAVKQQPWFAVPFVTMFVVLQTSRNSPSHSSARPMYTLALFLPMLGLGFLLPNLPFILWSPRAWLQGVIGPASLDLIPDGQGLVILQNQGVLALSRAQFGILMVFVLIFLCLAYFAYFDRIKNLLWLLPSFVLFFAYRSLHTYFVFWLPIAAMWIDLEFGSSEPERSPYPAKKPEG